MFRINPTDANFNRYSLFQFSDGKSHKKLLGNNGDGDDDDETRSGCACQRWLFISIFMPFILVVCILGFIGWLLLWPCKYICYNLLYCKAAVFCVLFLKVFFEKSSLTNGQFA